MYICTQPRNSTLRDLPKRKENMTTKIWAQMFITASLTAAQTWKESKCPSTGGRATHTVEGCSTTKNNRLSGKPQKHHAKWMKPDTTGYIQWNSMYTAFWKRQSRHVKKQLAFARSLWQDWRLTTKQPERIWEEGSAVRCFGGGDGYTVGNLSQTHQAVT